MIITIHGGHGYPGKGSTGVVGYINESIQDRIIKDKVKALLELDGHSVTDITVDEGSQKEILSKLVSRANAVNADLNVSIHFNASNGKGYGTEVWIKSQAENTANEAANRIVDRIVDLGFRNRGVKSSTSLYILNKMVRPSLLVECCFADNLDDFKKYDADKMARAIAEGIVGHQIVDAINTKRSVMDIIDYNKYAGKGNPVLRFYNSQTSEHFFTTSIVEGDVLLNSAWTLEGVAWVEPIYSEGGNIPVHRLINMQNGDHFFTASDIEAVYLAFNGWTYEGIAFYSDKKESVPVYRLYNPSKLGGSSHFYTASAEEKDNLLTLGWECEGIGWFGGAL